MNYSFNIQYAKKYGVEEAIMIHNFQFWIIKNKSNNKHQYDGRTWTYNSIKAMCELFPFWTEKQVRRILDSLIQQKILLTGNYNEKRYDRTLWYAFANESAFLAICQNGQMDLPERVNGSAQKGKPIPNNKPDTIPDFISHERLLIEVQKLFPHHRLPKNLPTQRLDYFLQQYEAGKIHLDVIKTPAAYIKGIIVADDYVPYNERAEQAVEAERRKAEDRHKERERLEALRNEREIPPEWREMKKQRYGMVAV